MSMDAKFQAGGTYKDAQKPSDSVFADPVKLATELLNDSAGRIKEASITEITGLIKDLVQNDSPLDDRKGTTELLIGILTSLPSTSKVRTQLTNKLIDTLWSNLQHPPLSYVGGNVEYDVVSAENVDRKDSSKTTDTIEFKVPGSDITLREKVPKAPDGLHQYRMPDGSSNNIHDPNLGQAGRPYAKSVRNRKNLHGVKPDPGLLFDLLMERDDRSFQENPAGISSMLFYHASIIMHDIFRTNRTDTNKSDTSSYLDLAPLYGSSLKDQLKIRTMREGKLKPDTFHEKRLLGQPAGVNVMLVLYNRFHNYVCDMLLKINEHGRFSVPCKPDSSPEDRAMALAKQDHNLFNTARLIVGGLYINICLHDYLRAITNTHHTNSDWTLDPRVAIGKQYDGDGVPRGVGNQVSVEFNLLYRFHSCISKKDERWINEFFLKLFPGRKADDLQNVSWVELGEALLKFEHSISEDPSMRTFDGLEREADGKFRDEDLVRILKEAMNDPAGCFGARMVPKALKMVEVLGINQARNWQVASLNEFREFFGLKRYTAFSEINSNPDIAKILEQLYADPDMVEFYPGIMIEDTKPQRNAGSGICPPYTLGRAILSDTVTLVRSDRFNTLDCTISNLTSWGYMEVQQDYETMGGSMLYKLIQRGLPGWFPFNSVALMQPMYTKKANEKIARELGTIDQFTMDEPKAPPKTVVVTSSAAIKKALDNPKQFAVPWLKVLSSMLTPKKDISWSMLAGDEPHNHEHRANIMRAMGDIPNLHQAVHSFIKDVGRQLIEQESFKLKEGLHQLDLIRDVAIPLNAQLLADLFYFDMRTKENPSGVLNASELYQHLINIRIWGVNNNDPAQAWNRRRCAAESVKTITATSRKLVDEVMVDRGLGLGMASKIAGVLSRKASLKKGSLRSCGYQFVMELLGQGNSAERVVDTLWMTAFGGVGLPVTSFYEVMEFFLRPENDSIWAEVQSLAQRDDRVALHAYVAEALRLTSTQRNVRVATQPAELQGKKVAPGNVVILMLGEAGRNASEVQDADKFDPQRESESVSSFSYGIHECLAKDVALAFMTGLVTLVADLKQLRPAPGQMGQVKTIQVGAEKAYLNDSWSHLAFDASTWKLHFNGHGKGIFKGQRNPTNALELERYYYVLQRQEEMLQTGIKSS